MHTAFRRRVRGPTTFRQSSSLQSRWIPQKACVAAGTGSMLAITSLNKKKMTSLSLLNCLSKLQVINSPNNGKSATENTISPKQSNPNSLSHPQVMVLKLKVPGMAYLNKHRPVSTTVFDRCPGTTREHRRARRQGG